VFGALGECERLQCIFLQLLGHQPVNQVQVTLFIPCHLEVGRGQRRSEIASLT